MEIQSMTPFCRVSCTEKISVFPLLFSTRTMKYPQRVSFSYISIFATGESKTTNQ